MSRRHHGRPNRATLGTTDGPRRGTGVESRPATAAELPPRPVGELPPRPAAPVPAVETAPSDAVEQAGPTQAVAESVVDAPDASPSFVPGTPSPATNGSEPRPGQCTAPQLRRFIKSRPYVPMHELRRRFSINGEDDDVTPVRLDPGWIYVGLPSHEGRLLGDLLRTGEIGYELSLDPRTPIVVGVYPMRPIARN